MALFSAKKRALFSEKERYFFPKRGLFFSEKSTLCFLRGEFLFNKNFTNHFFLMEVFGTHRVG